MARPIGTFNFPANFEVNKLGPLDARAVTPLATQLIDSSLPFAYLGMLVSVTEDTAEKNGLYMLTNADATQLLSWTKLGEGGGTTVTGASYSQATGELTITLSEGPDVVALINSGTLFEFTGVGNSHWTVNDPAGYESSNNVNNPTLYVNRGETYTFRRVTSGHPLDIENATTQASISAGITGGSLPVTQGNDLVWQVPHDAANEYEYHCTVVGHEAMRGTIKVVSGGEDGSDGTSGSSGLSGVDGVTGDKGDIGETGSHGTSGSSGLSGVDGVAGEKGAQGDAGSDGSDGTSGSSGLSGVDGVTGEKGNKGDAGSDGSDGTSGSSGLSGVDGVKGDKGDAGNDGSDGSAGSDGSHGTSGSSGLSGVDGIKGDKGDAGSDGAAGSDGSHGTSGSSGLSGVDGIKGDKGDAGNDGSDGAAGSCLLYTSPSPRD